MQDQPVDCDRVRSAILDTLSVIGGKWKLALITTLLIGGKKQFRQLARETGISPRILSKELYELELNKLVSREAKNTRPVTVEYASTPYCETLRELIINLSQWGTEHKNIITGRSPLPESAR